MSSPLCHQPIQWVLLNSVFLKVAAAIIMAVGIAGMVGGTVLCRGNTIQILNGDAVKGIYPEMGIPVLIYSSFILVVGTALAITVCVINRKYEPAYTSFFRRPEIHE